MILLLDTATPTAHLTIVDGEDCTDYQWEANRELAHGLLSWLQSMVSQSGKTFTDLRGIGVFEGPGSFTGLRIGMTVCNTLAESLQIPIVTTTGDDWRQVALDRLRAGENDEIALPLYDRDANITKPRK